MIRHVGIPAIRTANGISTHSEPICNSAETLWQYLIRAAPGPTGSAAREEGSSSARRRVFFAEVAKLVEEVEMFEAVRRIARPGEERRSHERQAMILRVGVLSQDQIASFCLIKNVSRTGVQVKLYGSSFHLGEVVIRVADEDPISAKIVWINKRSAGLEFDGSIDRVTLLRLQQKLSPVRRRSTPRISATSYAAVRVDGRNVQAVLRDISSMGARFTTSRALEVGSHALIRFPDLPEIRAHVRWTEESDCGLVFEAPIPMQVIAEWIEGRIRTSA